MPLSEKTRIEVYVPDLPTPRYRRLLESLRREFTHTFGGSTLVQNVSGSYLSRLGLTVEDRVNLLYTDAALDFDADAGLIDDYAGTLRREAHRALDEEAILVAVYRVRHSD